jgi:hypothetical protein
MIPLNFMREKMSGPNFRKTAIRNRGGPPDELAINLFSARISPAGFVS